MDLIEALDRTFAHAHDVVAGVRPDHYDVKTPCAEWNVRDLLEHMIGVVEGLGAAASGKAPAPFSLGADPAAQFRSAASSAMAGWRTPGVLDRIIDAGPGPMPGRALASINLLDTATHTWDLATATGQPSRLPDDIAAAALEASHVIVTEELRPGRFAPEVPTPAGSTATDTLVAFLGRTPD
jgi:uncharacterized protein (TIGR03086 family)